MAWAPVSSTKGSLDGVNEVELVAAPGASDSRIGLGGTIRNVDTVTHTVTVRTKVGANYYGGRTSTLPVGGTMDVPPCSLTGTTESLVAQMNEAMTTTNPTFDVVAVERTP